MSNEEATLTLISQEGNSFLVSIRLSEMSTLIKETFEDFPDKEITLSNLSSSFLMQVIEFCEHHNFMYPAPIPRPIPNDSLQTFIPDPYDVQFIQKYELDELITFLQNCNYLAIPSLIALAMARLAAIFNGHNVAELESELGLEVGGFTPQIEGQIKEENPWIMERFAEEANQLFHAPHQAKINYDSYNDNFENIYQQWQISSNKCHYPSIGNIC